MLQSFERPGRVPCLRWAIRALLDAAEGPRPNRVERRLERAHRSPTSRSAAGVTLVLVSLQRGGPGELPAQSRLRTVLGSEGAAARVTLRPLTAALPVAAPACGRPTKAEALAMRAADGPPGDPEGVLPAPRAGRERESLARSERRIAELERKIGEQQMELDFFRRALRQVRDERRRSGVPGGTASTRSSKR